MRWRMNWPVVGFLFLFLLAGSFLYTSAFAATPELKKRIVTERTGFLYDSFVARNPEIEGRPAYGDPAAPLTLIFYGDVRESETRRFLNDYLAPLDAYPIRVIYKYHVRAEENLTIAQALACLAQEAPERFWEALLVANTTTPSLPTVSFATCVEGDPPTMLRRDILEVETFGMIGISPRIYLGVGGRENTVIDGLPSLDRLEQLINYKMLEVGI